MSTLLSFFQPDVIEMLVMAGADLSAKTKNGETPFGMYNY